jgi:hypothetical protein
MADAMWERGLGAAEAAQWLGLDPSWYSYYMKADSAREKYNRGYWLSLYLFLDMLELAERKQDAALKTDILKAYYSADWSVLRTLQ